MTKTSLLIAFAFVMAACAPAAQPEPTVAPPTEAPQGEVVLEVPTIPPTVEVIPTVQEVASTVETVEEATALPAFASLPLVNANTGQSFTLGELAADKPVYVHMMATWCPKCRSSQGLLNSNVVPQVGDAAEFVSIDVQTQIDATQLADYSQNNGFGWTFAVANTDIMNALSEQFGRTVASAPSTPHFVLYPDGTFTELQTGSKSADQVIALINGA